MTHSYKLMTKVDSSMTKVDSLMTHSYESMIKVNN